jgi:hypothetical protein
MLPARLRQLPLGLRQPERHPHLAQHRDRRRQLGAGLVEAADSVVQLAEAEVAVGLEGTNSCSTATASPSRKWATEQNSPKHSTPASQLVEWPVNPPAQNELPKRFVAAPRRDSVLQEGLQIAGIAAAAVTRRGTLSSTRGVQENDRLHARFECKRSGKTHR